MAGPEESEDEVTGPLGDAVPAARQDAATHPLDTWGAWIIRWLGAMLTASVLGITLFLALEGDGWGVAWMVVFALPIGFVVAVLTIVAAVPVVGLGALAAAAPLWLFYFGGDLMAPTGPPIGDVLGLVTPAGLGGSVASYLAERQVSFRRPRWWVATFGTSWRVRS